MLLKTVTSGKLQPEGLISHRFSFNNFMEAYEVFGNAARENAMKVIISND
jgi:alcohol dehydrogenase